MGWRSKREEHGECTIEAEGENLMTSRTSVSTAVACAAALLVSASPSFAADAAAKDSQEWTPPRLADGQPDISGTWNNVRAAHIPLQLPEELRGKRLSLEERQALVEKRSDLRKAAQWEGHEKSLGVGAYANYWFDWYWEEPLAGDAPQLLIEPGSGMMPAMTPRAQESVAYHREHLHDSYATMETGDRCISRGIYGLMMPTAYNNGKMFFQTPDHLVILSEMIHNARIIPIDAGPHVNQNIELWEGDPRGHWEGNTLVVESTNFRPVANLRGPGSRAPQTRKRRVVERFTLIDAETLRYELKVDDPGTYADAWSVAFNYKRDGEYQQYEYACHEGNYSVPNSLRGARSEERR